MRCRPSANFVRRRSTEIFRCEAHHVQSNSETSPGGNCRGGSGGRIAGKIRGQGRVAEVETHADSDSNTDHHPPAEDGSRAGTRAACQEGDEVKLRVRVEGV